FEQLPTTAVYTVGTDSDSISYVYLNTVETRELSRIRYTTDPTAAAISQYYYNPVRLHDVYSHVGRGRFVLTCYYQMSSQIQILHTANITIQDSAILTVSYEDAVIHYTDAN
ncbi:hypothetical protein, partial [Salmonella sp. s51228]|uniref:hypothetical protein n=1 Tax=Salmonella sp. s51228 TaxID=3159652 RepID=UPI003980D87B